MAVECHRKGAVKGKKHRGDTPTMPSFKSQTTLENGHDQNLFSVPLSGRGIIVRVVDVVILGF